MPTQIADSEIDVVEPGVAPVPQGKGAKSFPHRLAETHRSKLPIIVWLILSLIWGSTWLFIKLGLEDLPPFTFAGIRFVIAALILLIIVAVRLHKQRLPRDWRDWVLIAGTGFFSFAVNYGLLFRG